MEPTTPEEKSTEKKDIPFLTHLKSSFRPTRSHFLVAILCAGLGFAIVAQVQQTNASPLQSYRESDLVRILDDVNRRADQLEQESARLNEVKEQLQSNTTKEKAAQEAAQRRAQTEGILAGTLPATGPGVTITVTQGGKHIDAAVLFNLLEELRNAGAEAIQLGNVRVVASTSIVDTDSGVTVDGQQLQAPYRWIAIGDASTISTALNITGGALAAVREQSGEASVESQASVDVTAITTLKTPQYAEPVE